jgi:sulfofructose kinase
LPLAIRLADNRPMRIICVGHTAFDRVFRVERIVAPPAKIAASAYLELGGGMAANAAVAIAHLGAEAHFWGPAGDDDVADAMAEDFARHGVDARAMWRIRGRRSSHSVILVDNSGERLIVGMRGDVLQDAGDWMPLHTIKAAAAMLVDVRWPGGSVRALAAARAAGVPSVLDGDTGERTALRRLVAEVDYAVFSEPGFACFTDAAPLAGLREALAAGARAAVVTRGERGCQWVTADAPEELRHTPAIPSTAIDTTGAGDAFHGAFTLCIAEGKSLESAIEFATAAASIKVGRLGSRSMPSRAEVESLLAGAA